MDAIATFRDDSETIMASHQTCIGSVEIAHVLPYVSVHVVKPEVVRSEHVHGSVQWKTVIELRPLVDPGPAQRGERSTC